MDDPLWLPRSILEALHRDLVGEHGGRLGMRDEGLLESALARPQHVFNYDADTDLATLAAEYAFGLVKNHAFMDGNKRIAFVAANVFLILNGFEMDAEEPVVVDVMQQLADGRMGSGAFIEWLRTVLRPYTE